MDGKQLPEVTYSFIPFGTSDVVRLTEKVGHCDDGTDNMPTP